MSPLAKSKSRGPDLAIILGGHKPAADDHEDGADEHEGSLHDAVEAFFKAGEEGDFKGAAEAYKTMHDLCASDDEGDEGDDGDEEEH